MSTKLWVVVAIIALTILDAPVASSQASKEDPLKPLLFLIGTWHGQGKSPYGPYEFEGTIERRGRWLVGTSNVFAPGTDQVSFVSTALMGYDEKGLVLYSFDLAGVTVFRGEAAEGGVRFEWKEGESWRRRTIKPLPDGKYQNREEGYVPAQMKEKYVFESVSLPGKRPRK